MERNTILNISPVDGRYSNVTDVLSQYFSEYAYIKYRVMVECKWLEYFVTKVLKREIDKNKVDKIYEEFSVDNALRVKEIESVTNHDVKAIEYYVREKLNELVLGDFESYVHILCTSEDINNLAQSLMIKDALDSVIYPNMENMIRDLKEKATEYKDITFVAHTHGQVATPTTVGKEFAVFVYRWNYMLDKILNIKLKGKFGGAVGNLAVHKITYRDIDWIECAKSFVESLGIEYNPLTTQIESHDTLCELLSYIKLFNNVTLDYNNDMWMYISKKYFNQKTVKTETGSSVMPHKVNPINHENSMANIHMANGVVDVFTNNLQQSRMQRDLSDSSTLRNLGVIFSHTLISIKQTIIATGKIEVNLDQIKLDLDSNPAVLSEAIQTILRKNGDVHAYEKLKELTRGKEITLEDLRTFITSLEIDALDKEVLLSLEPSNYIGYSSDLVDKI